MDLAQGSTAPTHVGAGGFSHSSGHVAFPITVSSRVNETPRQKIVVSIVGHASAVLS